MSGLLLEVFPGTSTWLKALWYAENMLEGLDILSGLGVPQEELESADGQRDAWVTFLSLLQPGGLNEIQRGALSSSIKPASEWFGPSGPL